MESTIIFSQHFALFYLSFELSKCISKDNIVHIFITLSFISFDLMQLSYIIFCLGWVLISHSCIKALLCEITTSNAQTYGSNCSVEQVRDEEYLFDEMKTIRKMNAISIHFTSLQRYDFKSELQINILLSEQ